MNVRGIAAPATKDQDVEATDGDHLVPGRVTDGNEGGHETAEGNDRSKTEVVPEKARAITFDASAEHHPKDDAALYIPGPRERDRGEPSRYMFVASQLTMLQAIPS